MVKIAAAIILSLLCLQVNAQDAKAQISEWIRHHFVDRKVSDFLGTTVEDGRPCGLFLTWIDNGGIIYLVVGNADNSRNDNDYVGMPLREALVSTISPSRIYMKSHSSWGNASTWNEVTVELNPQGLPYLAKGVSDVKTITCTVKGDGQTPPSS